MSEKLEKGGNIDQRERNTLWEDLVSTSDITSKNTWDILSHTLISQLDDHLNTFQDREIREIMTIIFKTQIHSEFFNEYLEEYWTDESKKWLIHLYDITSKGAQGLPVSCTSIKDYYGLTEKKIKTIINKTGWTPKKSFEIYMKLLEENVSGKDWIIDILRNEQSLYREEFIILWHRLWLAKKLIKEINQSINSRNVSKYFEFMSMGIE